MPTCWIKARCDRGRLTVDFAVDPLKTVRIARRRLLWTTKKMQARMMPKSNPITKSQLAHQLRASLICQAQKLEAYTVMPIAIAQMVMYSDRFTLLRVSQTASTVKSRPSTKIRAPTTMTAV